MKCLKRAQYNTQTIVWIILLILRSDSGEMDVCAIRG